MEGVVGGWESKSRTLFLSFLAAIIGFVAGGVAYGLYVLIAVCSNAVFFHTIGTHLPDLATHALGWWVIGVPVVGGVVVGAMAKYGSPKIKGHGIPEAMEAVIINRSRIAPRVAILKPLSAAIAIGTGGPFGAEGPIIQTGGALGSLVGQFLHVTAAERKVLLACGAAAGMAATFSTPIAAVILAIELLLFEFKSRSFIPLVIASTLATTVHFGLMGRGPMFHVSPIDFGIPSALPYYLVLGLVCGAFAVAFSRALYWVEDRFELLSIDELWHPAVGGLGLGLIAVVMPRVLGVGYGTISEILNNQLPLMILLGIVLLKSLALLVSLGSGTSGGLLAPLFMVGSALGGVLAIAINVSIPSAHLAPGAFALVGMAALFGAASRATFTFMIFAFELTQDYNAILPLMLAGVVADSVALMFMKNSIMTEKLARRGVRVHHEYESDVLHQLTVNDVMDKQPDAWPTTMPVAEAERLFSQHNSKRIRHQAFPLVDAQGNLAGIVTRGDILRAMGEDHVEGKTLGDIGSGDLAVAYPDETLHEASLTMLQRGIGRLPVVSRANSKHLIGYLGRTAIFEARLHRLHEEHRKESGWLRVRKSRR